MNNIDKKNILDKIKDFWVNRKFLADEANAKKDANSFLPGVLDVTDAPPNPLVKRVAYCLIFLLVFVLIWSFFFRIDIVTVGEGKVIPAGDVKTIQSSEKGTVIGINVDNGQMVKKGDILVVLESDMTESDIDKLQENIEFYKLRIAREEVLYDMMINHKKEFIPLDKVVFTPPKDVVDQLDIDQSKRLLWQQWQSGIAKLMTLEAVLASKQQEKAISINKTHQLEEMLEIVNDKLETYSGLYKSHTVSKMEYLEFKEKYLNIYYELQTEKGKDLQFEAQIAEADSNLQSYKSQAYLDIFESIQQDKKDLYDKEQELRKATSLNGKNIIKKTVELI